jgi:hypothetical protein
LEINPTWRTLSACRVETFSTAVFARAYPDDLAAALQRADFLSHDIPGGLRMNYDKFTRNRAARISFRRSSREFWRKIGFLPASAPAPK